MPRGNPARAIEIDPLAASIVAGTTVPSLARASARCSGEPSLAASSRAAVVHSPVGVAVTPSTTSCGRPQSAIRSSDTSRSSCSCQNVVSGLWSSTRSTPSSTIK
ncbi:hypothetical protein [Nannocystis pusilla]|uniref:hypothetical protein n=1 Tax=Nannocystis pusilla TaxID=889268 RepID=UPI003B7F311F